MNWRTKRWRVHGPADGSVPLTADVGTADMKTLCIAVWMSLLALTCPGAEQATVTVLALTTNVVRFDSPRLGAVRIETTMRGNERVLRVTQYQNVTVRVLYLHGDQRYIEADENGDGLFESIMIPGGGMTDYEQFTRMPDGTIVPLSDKADTALKEKMRSAADHLMHNFQDIQREGK
jgi:hypothetical protein